MRELIRKILRETVSIQLRRRMTRGGELDKLINKFRLTSFMKNTPIGGSVEKTIRQVANEVFPNEMSYATHAEADEDWNGLLKFLYDQYGEELTQYFEKRQENYDNEQNPLEYQYIFAKHDGPYGGVRTRGFSASFDNYDDLVTKYGNWVNVDWNEIKRKLDNIKDFPVETYTHYKQSYPIRISSIGDEGNNWGYHFSVIKAIPRENVDKV